MILVTNDDGIFSKGIKALIEVALEFDKVIVVAPDRGQSATSHSITLKEPMIYKKTDIFGKKIPAYQCSGKPADNIKLALNHILQKKPDLVLSGINHGSNTSVNLIYSGTVAAAVEASMHKIPSIAFSVDSHNENANFDAAKFYARKIIKKIFNANKIDNICLNVNVPYIPLNKINGIKFCKQTNGAWFEDFEQIENDKNGNPQFFLKGKYINFEPERTDTDIYAIENNFVSIVPVKIDFTNYKILDKIKYWKL